MDSRTIQYHLSKPYACVEDHTRDRVTGHALAIRGVSAFRSDVTLVGGGKDTFPEIFSEMVEEGMTNPWCEHGKMVREGS